MKTVIRAFFKALRVIAGPVMMLWEFLSRPKGISRTPALQAEVDLQCGDLRLYQYRTCPFCVKVRQEIRRLSLKIEKLDAQTVESNRADLVHGGGQAKVPCLRITDTEGHSQWMYESSEIIAYLRGRFALA